MNVLIESPANTQSGYGHHSRDIIKSLFKLYPDWNFMFILTKWGNTPSNAIDSTTDWGKKILDNVIRGQLSVRPDIHIQITVPNEARPLGTYSILITAGMETTICSHQFIEGANRMDLILVPSEHSKQVMEQTIWEQKNGATGQSFKLQLQKPIQVLFEGVDVNVYRENVEMSGELGVTLNELPDFTFLYVGHWLQGDLYHDRKDTGGLVKTFMETFKHLPPEEQPALLLKTSGAGFSYLDRKDILFKINKIKESLKTKNLPKIYVLHGQLTNEEINQLYNHPKIKAFVSFTHGEGYGRPFAEFAAATKKPILAPKWSGQLDFLDERYSVLLDGELKNVHPSAVWEGFILKESKWFYVDYEAAKQKMLDVVKNYNSYANKAGLLKKSITNKFTLDNMTAELKKIIDEKLKFIPQGMALNLPKLPALKKVEGGLPSDK